MRDEVEVICGPNGEMYLALRKSLPQQQPYNHDKVSKEDESRVIIIDMWGDEDDNKVFYEV
tara:strand:+ start:706 stop:888 length:183 start_codon:yes stop_codon:yes gene_type:complete